MVYNSRPNSHHSRGQRDPLNDVINDLPKGNLKAALHLFQQTGTIGKLLLGAAALVAGKAFIDKFNK